MTKTRIKMYKKNTHTNVGKKHAYKYAYKCMTKTGIQMYKKNTHTNMHTNVGKKRIQIRIEIYEKNKHTNV